MEKIPYMLIIGDQEMNEHRVSLRLRDRQENIQLPTAEFISKVVAEIADRRMTSSFLPEQPEKA